MPTADQINTNASQPKSVKTDKVEVTAHGIKDQIAADHHAKTDVAASKASFGLRMTKLVPPGGG